MLILLLLLSLLIATDLLAGGSSLYTSTDKTNKNEIYIKETIQKHSTNNTKNTVNTGIHITKTPTHCVCVCVCM